ncbi:hypothetical protein ACO0LO_10610 [Undibacterium sp. TJN25]|uniref:hypothetical protein n=1 Tax=Undibacterium sp. TJN25 TaxID=3413056 RepID=UPI003BF335E9
MDFSFPPCVAERKFPKPAKIGYEQMQRMEKEMSCLQGQYKEVEQVYGQQLLNLVVVKVYLTTLSRNERISAYLKSHYLDVYQGIESILGTVEQAEQLSG